jgi:hypothetical protein
MKSKILEKDTGFLRWEHSSNASIYWYILGLNSNIELG